MSVETGRRAQSIFEMPEIYEMTFGYRDIPREVDFIFAAFRKAFGFEPDSVLDVACGTGVHAREFARRGCRVCGIDKSQTMVSYAQARAEEERLEMDLRCLDMGDFHIEGDFHCAVCMLHSLAYLTTNRELTHHFACVSRALADRGLYVLELGNPRSWITDPPRTKRERWDGGSWSETRDGLRIRGTVYRDPMDHVSQTARVETQVDLTARGVSRRLSDTATQRVLWPQELRALAEMGGGFHLASYYGEFSLDEPLASSSRTKRMIGVFTRLSRTRRTSGEEADQQTLLAC